MSATSRQAALDAAVELLDERGVPGLTVDEVARRSGVSKATIYKHWASALPMAAEAYGKVVTDAVPVVDTGDAVADLTNQICRLAAFYGTARGRVVGQLMGAATSQERGGTALRDGFFAARRTATVDLIRRGQERGQLRADLDPELTIDLLFGAIIFRLFNGLDPLDAAGARAIADMGMRAIATHDGAAPS